jgi:formylglycine-generating enzyme required for sulfatase activity
MHRRIPLALWVAVTACRSDGGADADALRRAATTPRGSLLVAIPAAEFEYPETGGRFAARVTLPAFRIEATEVTVAAYRACVEAGACSAPPAAGAEREIGKQPLPMTCNWGQAGRDDHPINCLSFAEADAYCAWNHGRRLPTLFELYWAAVGGPDVPEAARLDSRAMPRFPWGDDEPGTQRLCWQRGTFGGFRGGVTGPVTKAPPPAPADLGTCPVASAADDRSAFGVHDLAGNLTELAEDPLRPPCWSRELGDHRCPRSERMAETGGSWFAGGMAGNLSLKSRSGALDMRADTTGFRCVEGPPTEATSR